MRRRYDHGIKLCAALCFMVFALLGCATGQPPAHDEGVALMAQGRYEEGIAKLEFAIKQDPRDFKIRADLINLREQALNRLLTAAANERASGRLETAAELYRRVISIEPASQRARSGLSELERDRRHAEAVREAKEVWGKGNSEGAWSRLQSVLKENPANPQARELKRQIEEQRARELASIPTLRSMYDGRAISIDFRDANVRQVFEALARESGVTFVFDKDLRPDLRTTIVARQTSFEDAVELILMTNQLQKKIINRNTVLVYAATAPKLREYQDLVVKGFYLTYADVKQTQNLIKTVIKSKDMFVDEKMNLIVLRDTPDAIRLAEKLIAMHDLGAPEVMLDVEVLEVQRNKLLDMGIQWPNQLTLTPLPSSGTTTTLRDLTNITAATTGATLANAILNLRRDSGIVNLLANPRIRSLNREKARILIGDKVPVITTTSTATGFASQSVQYLDVGLKLEVEPSIYLQDEVAIKVSLEVSNIVREVQTAGVLTYQIGSRSAAAVLRLKDGETQVLAGLINDQDRRTASGVPGLGDLPVAGRLFRSQRDDVQKSEIVLSITPHLIRNVTLPDATASEFLSGTEATLRSPRAFAIAGVSRGSQVASARPGGGTLTLSGAGTAAAVAASNVSLAWNGPQQARVGEPFRVALMVKASSPLRSVPVQLGFDPATFEVVEITEGGFFKQGNAKSSFASNIDAAGGRIIVGVSRSDNEGSTGEAELVTVTFRAKAPHPKAELRVLAVTAVAPSGAVANVTIPGPLIVSIGK